MSLPPGGCAPLISVQLCTYNRRRLLAKVLQALFDQQLPRSQYEVILVDDGSDDGTAEEVISRLQPSCALHVVRQRNAGLARGRNVGLARARGKIVLFMDDDVLATPGLLSAHLRFHRSHSRAICRGAVINVSSFDALPPPRYSWRNYSGAYFWTTNVSVPKELLEQVGGFDERFREYGWEDLELGFRLRKVGVRSLLSRDALVYHYKPWPRVCDQAALVRQTRAQARTAVQFLRKHPHWRVALATGQLAAPMRLSALARRVGWTRLLQRLSVLAGEGAQARSRIGRWAAGRLLRAAYYDEIAKQDGS
ncbi:MAG: glycosyltransferase [Candidatus Eremiobacteraeota bacterium]|nr:glycosyltransferase [Candidatus Eremiobacteraeota bacterium]MBC5827176.1 glycosyltransferase [Candidatus Eremiobacteraeota bacterium]